MNAENISARVRIGVLLLIAALAASPAGAQPNRSPETLDRIVENKELVDAVMIRLAEAQALTGLIPQVPSCVPGSSSTQCRQDIARAFFDVEADRDFIRFNTRFWRFGEAGTKEPYTYFAFAHLLSLTTNKGRFLDWSYDTSAILMIVCSQRDEFNVPVSLGWNEPLRTFNDPSDARVPVTLWLDDEPLPKENWVISEDRRYAHYDGDALALIDAIAKSARLRAHVIPVSDKTTYSAQFDVSRFKHLAPLMRDECVAK